MPALPRPDLAPGPHRDLVDGAPRPPSRGRLAQPADPRGSCRLQPYDRLPRLLVATPARVGRRGAPRGGDGRRSPISKGCGLPQAPQKTPPTPARASPAGKMSSPWSAPTWSPAPDFSWSPARPASARQSWSRLPVIGVRGSSPGAPDCRCRGRSRSCPSAMRCKRFSVRATTGEPGARRLPGLRPRLGRAPAAELTSDKDPAPGLDAWPGHASSRQRHAPRDARRDGRWPG